MVEERLIEKEERATHFKYYPTNFLEGTEEIHSNLSEYPASGV
jgi:hypothetical protein